MNSRLQHILTLLGVIAIPIVTIWQSSSDMAAKIAMSVATVIALCFNLAQRKQIEQIVLGALAVLGPVATIIFTHVTTGSAIASFIGVALAVITDLTKALTGQDLNKRAVPPTTDSSTGAKVSGAAAGILLMLLCSSALAQTPTPNDVAPPLSFCFGATTTCVVEDFNLQMINYDLIAKQWSGGITAAGIGYALLYRSDTPYASGAAVHVAFNFDQGSPSYFAPTFSAVFCHWFEAGYTPVFYDGHIGQKITLMVGLNAEQVMTMLTGKRLGQRLAAKIASAEKVVQ